MWNDITYPLPNFNGSWSLHLISNFIIHFTGYASTYICILGLNLIHVSERGYVPTGLGLQNGHVGGKAFIFNGKSRSTLYLETKENRNAILLTLKKVRKGVISYAYSVTVLPLPPPSLPLLPPPPPVITPMPHPSASEKRQIHQTFPMARPKCLMGDFTNLYRIYKAHQTNVWWTMKDFRLHCHPDTTPLPSSSSSHHSLLSAPQLLSTLVTSTLPLPPVPRPGKILSPTHLQRSQSKRLLHMCGVKRKYFFMGFQNSVLVTFSKKIFLWKSAWRRCSLEGAEQVLCRRRVYSGCGGSRMGMREVGAMVTSGAV